jgi:hypothetical protein
MLPMTTISKTNLKGTDVEYGRCKLKHKRHSKLCCCWNWIVSSTVYATLPCVIWHHAPLFVSCLFWPASLRAETDNKESMEPRLKFRKKKGGCNSERRLSLTHVHLNFFNTSVCRTHPDIRAKHWSYTLYFNAIIGFVKINFSNKKSVGTNKVYEIANNVSERYY